jgi:phosphatidylglycerol---prolipoprotein diacylglyceryl transferase
VPVAGGGYLAHPTPLYDIAFNLAWFAILLLMRDHPWMQNGNLLKVGVAGYAGFRFFNEFLRNNRVFLFGLTGQQFACIALFVAVVVYFVRNSRPKGMFVRAA